MWKNQLITERAASGRSRSRRGGPLAMPTRDISSTLPRNTYPTTWMSWLMRKTWIGLSTWVPLVFPGKFGEWWHMLTCSGGDCPGVPLRYIKERRIARFLVPPAVQNERGGDSLVSETNPDFNNYDLSLVLPAFHEFISTPCQSPQLFPNAIIPFIGGCESTQFVSQKPIYNCQKVGQLFEHLLAFRL